MSWIGNGDERYLKLIPTLEKMSKAPDITTYTKLFAILSSHLSGRFSSLVRAESENRDGFKLWYDFMRELQPSTKQRSQSSSDSGLL